VIGDGGKELSGGQMQRLSIARAVYADRQIMILDECTSALDSDIRKRVLENLSGLEGKTYVYVTHQEDVLSICDRCYKI
jgi:ATP-binding cassette subfamily B protein